MTDREQAEQIARNFVPGSASMRVGRLTNLLLEMRAREAERICGKDCTVGNCSDKRRAATLREQIKEKG